MSNEEILGELLTVKEQVEEILQKYPESRNNDFYLALLVLKHFYLPELPYIKWEKIKDLSGKLKSINNLRQEFNRQGLYLPTDPEVLEHRKQRGHQLRQIIPRLKEAETLGDFTI